MYHKIRKREFSFYSKSKIINNENQNQIFFPQKPKTPIKLFNNNKYTNKKNLIAYWEVRNKKKEEKLEKIRKERYDKEFGELKKKPKINENSKKIMNKLNNSEKNLIKHNLTFNNIKTSQTNNNILTDYYEIFNKRKLEKNLSLKSEKPKVKIRLNSNKNKSNIKEENKNNKDLYSYYYLYDAEKVNNVRNKFHNYLSFKPYQKENYNNDYKKISNNYNIDKEEKFLNEYSKLNKYDNSYKKVNQNKNINFEMNNKGINKINYNEFKDFSKIKNNNDLNNNKNINNYNKKESEQNNLTINRREEDLEKFMLFTNNLNLIINKEKPNIKKQDLNQKQNQLSKSSILRKTKELPIQSPEITDI